MVDALYGAEKRLQKLTAAAACPVMPEVVAEGKCFGDWILLPLLCRPEAAPLRDMAGVMAGGLYTGDTAPWQVFIHDGDDFGWAPGVAVSDTEKDAGETLFDPALLTFRYPYQRETTLPAKLTATQLKGRALDQEIAEDAYHTPYIQPLVQPKFRREKKGLTPAERGTATHLVLQYLDFSDPDAAGQVEDLRRRGLLTDQQAAAVETAPLERFLKSDLAEEIRRAGNVLREYRFTLLMDERDYDPAATGDDRMLLQGVVDCCFETAAGLTVTICGRGYAARLLDNESRPVTYQGATLAEIVRCHAAPYGISSAEIAPVSADSVYTVAAGTSQWKALEGFCRTYGGFSPRFRRDGLLVAAPERDDGRRIVIDGTSPILSCTLREDHYGVLTEVLVIDKTRNVSYSVQNRDMLDRGGQCRRVVYTPGQSTWAAMRYTGEYQIRQSREEELTIELGLAGCFPAFPGDTVRLELGAMGLSGEYRVAEAENTASPETGEVCTLILRERI